MMRYLNPDQTSKNIHLSSPAPDSVGRTYHKILGAVKERRTTPPGDKGRPYKGYAAGSGASVVVTGWLALPRDALTPAADQASAPST